MITTRAERLWIYMRRHNIRADIMANEMGVTINRVSEWLQGEDDPSIPEPPHPAEGGLLEPWEKMSIWRRRKGWTVKEAGAKIGVSHVTLLRHERGKGNWEVTFAWWKRHRGEVVGERAG